MKHLNLKLIAVFVGGFISVNVVPEAYSVPEYQAPNVIQLQAKTIKTFNAPEADQGVAVDKSYFYAVDNTVIGKYHRKTGDFVKRWISPKRGLIRHMNSCYTEKGKLWCANSNYSLTPMASSIEVFDSKSLEHIYSHSLGITDEGSLVWFDKVNEGFIAGFAHYSKKGGEIFKSHEYSSVVLFDKSWRRMGGWAFPNTVLERMAPYSASGGVISKNGYLYIMGHDLPEMYVLGKPKMGPTLLHLATIELEAHGQAFSFDPKHENHVWVIDREAKKVKVIRLPELDIKHEDALAFSFGKASIFR